MALPTVDVTPGAGRTINTPNSGRQAAADSQAMVLSTEDKAALDLVAAASGAPANAAYADATGAVAGTLVGLLKGIVVALLSGTARTITRSALKGTSAAGDVTSTAASANRQPLDVVAYDAAGNPITQVGNPTQVQLALAAGVAATALAANAAVIGARILNFNASPVYLTPGTAGTPNSGGGSDYIPAATAGVPGQWEAPYRPFNGLRVVSAAVCDLTVISW